MALKKYIPVWLFFCGLLLWLFCGCGMGEQNPVSEIDFSAGDLVFRKGNGAKSRAVLQADTSGIYSHTGIVVHTDSGYMVVHITPGERKEGETVDKIKLETPERFFASKRAKKGAVMRFRDSLECSVQAAEYALLFYETEMLFDHDYNLEDTTKMYCTELIWHVYKHAGRDVSKGKRSVIKSFPLYSGTYIFPSDIYGNDQLILLYEF